MYFGEFIRFGWSLWWRWDTFYLSLCLASIFQLRIAVDCNRQCSSVWHLKLALYVLMMWKAAYIFFKANTLLVVLIEGNYFANLNIHF